MKVTIPAVLIAAVVLAGCTESQLAANRARPDYFKQRVTNTDSQIPERKDQLTYNPEFANSPSQSVARNTPSLYPTDPVVGANAGPADTGDTGPNKNVGAGPAGSAPLPGAN